MTRSLLFNQKKNQGCCCLMSTTADKASDDKVVDDKTSETPEPKVNEETAAQIKKLEEDVKDGKDKYMRALAESENLRRRMTKQVDDAKLFGIQGFCKDLLEVSDILSRAVEAVPKDQLNNSNPHLVSLYEGLNMTDKQLVKVFKKHGLEQISPNEGDKFDPNFMEALFNVPVQDQEKQQGDTVAYVQQTGFQLHTRTIRPAKVGVYKS